MKYGFSGMRAPIKFNYADQLRNAVTAIASGIEYVGRVRNKNSTLENSENSSSNLTARLNESFGDALDRVRDFMREHNMVGTILERKKTLSDVELRFLLGPAMQTLTNLPISEPANVVRTFFTKFPGAYTECGELRIVKCEFK